MGKAQDARDTESQAEIDEIEQQLTGLPQAIASNDGRKADERPITDRDIEMHVPAHVAENYADVVASRHDGDWNALADGFDQEGDFEKAEGRTANVRSHRVMAAWARRKHAEGGSKPTTDAPASPATDTPVVDPTTTPPKGRTAPGKSTT